MKKICSSFNQNIIANPVIRILISAVLIGLLLLTLFTYWSRIFIEKVEEQRKAGIVQIVNLARNTIDPVVVQVRKGRFTREEGLSHVRSIVRKMVYEDQYGRNYIFMSAYDGTMLVQPFEPQKEMTNQWLLKDMRGKYIIQELVRTARSNPKGGFVSYYYHPPGAYKTQEKLAFVVGIPELGCYIGTGMYLQKALAEQRSIIYQALYWTIGILIFLFIMVMLTVYEVVRRNRSLVKEIAERKQAEEEIRKLSAGIDNAFDGVVMTDARGNVTYANDSAINVLGYSRDEVLQMNVAEFTQAPDAGQGIIGGVMQKGVWSGEVMGMRKNREAFPANLSISLISDDKGGPIAMMGAFRDITERRQWEEALRESQQRLADIIEFLPDATFVIDRDGKIIAWNKAVEEMTGIRAEDMLGKGDYEYAIPFYGEKRPILIDLVMMPREVIDKEYFFLQREKDVLIGETNVPRVRGVNRFLSGKAAVIRNMRGEIIGAIESIRDMTEKRMTEQALKESYDSLEEKVRERTAELAAAEEKYRNLVERANDGIVIAQDAIIKYTNPRASEIAGYSTEEMYGRPFAGYVHPDELQKVSERYQHRISGEQVESVYETALIHKDGHRVDVEFNVGVIPYEGRPAVLVIIRDITERKRIEDELIKIQRLESIGTLAGGIAHDFNNLLTGIMGNISLSKLFVKDEKAIERLTCAEAACDQAKELTARLITFSRGGEPHRRIVSIVPLIRHTVQLTLSGSNVLSAFSLPDDLWTVEVDRGQIRQFLLNLVQNAKEAMPEGGTVTIMAENIMVTSNDNLPIIDGPYVRLAIKDTGFGIPAEHLGRIFDPYYSTKPKGPAKGMGLGLTVCYSIIKKHYGHITIESKPGEGTTIHAYLPAHTGEEHDI